MTGRYAAVSEIRGGRGHDPHPSSSLARTPVRNGERRRRLHRGREAPSYLGRTIMDGWMDGTLRSPRLSRSLRVVVCLHLRLCLIIDLDYSLSPSSWLVVVV